jgi:uncharacterized iron-regulated protein
MRSIPMALLSASLVAVACRAPAPPPVLGDGVRVMDATTGAPLTADALTSRLAGADVVLLGELHDNPAHHRVRGALVASAAGRRASYVFEHFTRSAAPIARPADAEAREAWLDRTGFDRTGWAWPVHAPLVDAALATGRPMRGSNLSREALREVVRRGAAAGPTDVQPLLAAAPMSDTLRRGLEAELVAGHCGALPASMLPGMRDAQVVRDAAMAQALVAARPDGPAWLLAGNGHVRMDWAVPRLLRAAHPDWRLLSVGFLETGADGGLPAATEWRGRYDIVVITPPVAGRPDPCAQFRSGPPR